MARSFSTDIVPSKLFTYYYDNSNISIIGLGIVIRYAVLKYICDGNLLAAEDLYSKYKQHRSIHRYISLYKKIESNGYSSKHPIVVNPFNFYYINGAHRIACCLMLTVSSIPVQYSITCKPITKTVPRQDLYSYLSTHEKGYINSEVDLIIDTVNSLTK